MNLLEFAFLCFTSLFSVINPIGIIPVYIGLTTGLKPEERNKIAVKAVFLAFIILFLFAVMGELIFKFFSISTNGFRVAGGVIFFIMGYDMLQARVSRTRDVSESVKEYASDIAVTPLAIPMICGPGAISMSIILMQDATTILHKSVFFSILLLILGIALSGLLAAAKVSRFLGENGNRVLLRLMGLIVMVIAVEFFFAGLKPIIRDILHLNP
jgi:multiple antibiotic resistance protein